MPSSPPCSRSATNSRFTASTVARSRVTQSTPGGQVALKLSRSRPKWNRTKTMTREEGHRRHRLARPELDRQVLAEDRERGARHRYEARGAPRVGRARRAGRERLAPAPQAEREVRPPRARPPRRGSRARGCAPAARPISGSSSPAAAGSRPARGSSSSSSGGSCSTARATAARCTIPRESSRTGSSARRPSPTRSRSSLDALVRRRRGGAPGSQVLARLSSR